MIHKTTYKLLFPLVFSLLIMLGAYTTSIAPVYEGPDIKIIGQDFYKDLESEFKLYGYQLDVLENGVPAIILQNLPSDLNKIKSVKLRKSIFFKSLLPMILLANDEITVERNQLLLIDKQLTQHKNLTPSELQTLQVLAARYKVKYDSLKLKDTINNLISRVDIIPADLALAQAANESAWGTSRFTQVANNIFGEWTFTKGQGIVPMDRPVGETYEVQKFATVYDSVRSYLHNLNTHSAYQHLRQLRAQYRTTGNYPEGMKLAEGLIRYSTRGEDYIKELQAMMRTNKLDRFASVKLRTSS